MDFAAFMTSLLFAPRVKTNILAARSMPWAGADGSRRPKPGRRLNADDISQAHARQRRSQRRVDPVTGVRQYHPFRHALGARGADLVERDLRFGLEDDVLGHAGSGPANWIGHPILGKIEPKGDRQARVLVGY